MAKTRQTSRGESRSRALEQISFGNRLVYSERRNVIASRRREGSELGGL